MNLALLSASLSRQAGGIFEIELALAKHLTALGIRCQALGLADAQWPVDAAHWAPLEAQAFPVQGPAAFGFSPGLGRALEESPAEIAHLQTLWMYPSVALHRWSRLHTRPYIVTPNGMLEPWALRNSGWKKRLAGVLYENRMLRDATCLQANTTKEAADIRAYGLRNPIAVIPNGINLPVAPPTMASPWEKYLDPDRKVLLYLGRIHPKKNLRELIRAWASIQPKNLDWTLIIAGWDQGGYEDVLKKQADESNLNWADIREDRAIVSTQNDLLFLGPQFGDHKAAAFFHSDAFILPSLSEGLPMVVLEAWSWNLPVVMTQQCNLPESFRLHAALETQTTAASIAASIAELIALAENERKKIGENGRKLVEAQFTWDKVALQMRDVYRWVLGQASRPTCVEQL
jgi:glycosyltransferase involved in cell wall biosynthesis